MNKLAMIIVLASTVSSHAAQTAEASRVCAEASFGALSSFKTAQPPAAPAAAESKPAFRPQSVAASYVNLSGQVNLQGSGYVPAGSRWVSVNLTGWTDIQDGSGQIRSGMANVSYMANFFVNGTWVSDWARPSVYVSLYKNGRYIGTAHVDGSIYVSGMLSGGWVRVSGSGALTGQASIPD